MAVFDDLPEFGRDRQACLAVDLVFELTDEDVDHRKLSLTEPLTRDSTGPAVRKRRSGLLPLSGSPPSSRLRVCPIARVIWGDVCSGALRILLAKDNL
jgi:hypothetical protein